MREDRARMRGSSGKDEGRFREGSGGSGEDQGKIREERGGSGEERRGSVEDQGIQIVLRLR